MPFELALVALISLSPIRAMEFSLAIPNDEEHLVLCHCLSSKPAQHVVFDEAVNDLVDKSPNARILDSVRNGVPVDPNVFNAADALPDLEVSFNPFLEFATITVPLDLATDSPFGVSDRTTPARRHGLCSTSSLNSTQEMRNDSFANN
jgi:hypothetical protein